MTEPRTPASDDAERGASSSPHAPDADPAPAAAPRTGPLHVAPEDAASRERRRLLRRRLDARPPHEEEAEPGKAREIIAEGRERWWELRHTRPWRAFSRFTQVGGGVLAAGMSYQALFAVFAGVWLGFGVLGIWLRGRPELLDTLITQINLFVPGLIGNEPNNLVSVQSVLHTPVISLSSVIAGVSLVFVAVLWFTGTRRAIRIIFGLEVKEYRNWALLKIRDLVLAVCFSVAMVISAGLMLVSSTMFEDLLGLVGWNADNWIASGLGHITRYAAMFVFDSIVLMAMLRYLAEIRVPRRHLASGAALGAGMLLLLKLGGTALLGGAASNPLLAPFAVLVGLLLWFNFICRALLFTAAWVAAGEDDELGAPEGRFQFEF